MTYTIAPDCDSMTVREYLRRELGLSHAQITRLKRRERGILLRGERVTVRALLCAGDTLELDEADGCDEVNEYLEPVDLPFEVLYEDADLLAVNKPAGMPTHPSHGHRRDTLANAAAFYFAGCGVPYVFRAVNRLDSGTSGVVLLAKNKRAAYTFGMGAKPDGGRGGVPRIEKEYFAVLRGIINPAEPLRGVNYITDGIRSDTACTDSADSCQVGVGNTGRRSGPRHAYCAAVNGNACGASDAAPELDGTLIKLSCGTVEAPIRRALPSIMLREVSFTPDASHAVTEFETLQVIDGGRFGPLTAVRAFPQTGRTHQLRVHFDYIGCPIAGDTLYGRFATDADQPIARQALHCAAMTVAGRRIEAPLPGDIIKLMNTEISYG